MLCMWSEACCARRLLVIGAHISVIRWKVVIQPQYSYIWAEVLDCDAFEAFKETGDIFSPEVAAKFRTYVLSPGGIDEGMDMYKNFRGKEPDTEPLLKNRGLNNLITDIRR